jgi:hypothetical protein
MNIEINWQEPVQLTHHKRMLFDKYNIPASIEDKAGVYFFSRVLGKTDRAILYRPVKYHSE